MRQIIKRNLPHARIPYDTIGNAQLKDCVMKINDNINSLKKSIAALEDAVIELQRR